MAQSDADAATAQVAVFLDRDGVINRLISGDYVRRWADFEFLPGAIEALLRLHATGARLLVVTNQRGVARGRVGVADLDEIHRQLAATLAAAGAPLEGVYACPHDIGTCNCRKPGVGLFEQARAAHPWINFSRSEMIGDSLADLVAGQRLGIRCWLVGERRRRVRLAAAIRGVPVAGSAPSLAQLVDGPLLGTLSR